MFGCRLSKLVLDRLNEIVLLPSLFHQPLAHNIHYSGGSVVKNLPVNSGDSGFKGLIPGSGRSLGGENGNPLQYSCLGNPKDRGAWWATVHGVAQSDMNKAT